MKKKIMVDWPEQMVQMNGIKVFGNNPAANCLLTRPLLRPEEETDLLRMRSNFFPTRTFINRINEEVTRSCRKCHAKDDTMAHVVKECNFK